MRLTQIRDALNYILDNKLVPADTRFFHDKSQIMLTGTAGLPNIDSQTEQKLRGFGLKPNYARAWGFDTEDEIFERCQNCGKTKCDCECFDHCEFCGVYSETGDLQHRPECDRNAEEDDDL